MKENKNINLKKDAGFTTADITISIVIIVMFVSIITTAYYNYYLSVTAKNRIAIATNCIVDVIEAVELMDYDDVNIENVNSKIQDLYGTNIPSQYTITAKVQKYNETEENTNKQDIIKILTVNAKYNIGKNTKEIEIKRLIIK